MVRLSIISVLFFIGSVAHGQPSADSDLSSRVKDILRARCGDCHGGKKPKAKLSILNHAKLVEDKQVIPGKPDESEIFKRIVSTEEGSRMPPAPAPALESAEMRILRRWILSGAKAFPEDVIAPVEPQKEESFAKVKGIEYVHRQILAHVETLDEKDLPYIRYFSVNHLLTTGISRERLDLYRDAIAKAINHLSSESEITPLTIIDPPTGSLFAIDLRKIGWGKKPFVRKGKENSVGASEVNLWDLVLLEYPYGILYPDSEVFSKLHSRYLKPAGMVRPIPFIRGDWFVSTATQPPLYEDLLGLPRTVSELKVLLKLDSEQNVKERKAFRAGMTESGVSRNNRVVERHPLTLREGYFYESFDFQSSRGRENMFADPLHLKPAGGEFIFTLPNKTQGYFVANAQGQRVEFAPTSIVTDSFASDKTVRNGLACMRCHDKGMKTFLDTVRPALEKLPGQPSFDRKEALDLYPPQKQWDDFLKKDGALFLGAMKQIQGSAPAIEPLAPTSREYLDTAISLPRAAGELGLIDSDDIRSVFRLPQFAGLGLASLASDGRVRRDSWEEYHPAVVRLLGLGTPVIPLDALTRPDVLPENLSTQVVVKTNRKGNVFAPGDKAIIEVQNLSKNDLYIEMTGTGADGRISVLVTSETRLKAGETFRFPPEGGIIVRGGNGRDVVTVYASATPFAGGELLRGDAHVADRFLHRLENIQFEKGRLVIETHAHQMVKKTLEIETK